MGKIQGESVERKHLIPCINVTSSGIKVKSVVNRLRKLKLLADFTNDLNVSDAGGNMCASTEIGGLLVNVLEELFEDQSKFFPPEVKNLLDIRDRYHSFRNWRRTSDTRSVEINVPDKDIYMVNRQNTVKQSKGRNQTSL